VTGQSWVFVKASWKGGTKFTVENRSGCRSTIEARVPQGEASRHFSPVDTFLASLAACAGTNVLVLLQNHGATVRSLTVKAECILQHASPMAFEKIHLIFLTATDAGDGTVSGAIEESMTLVCPIAVTIGRAAEVTWEQQVTPR